MSKGRIMVVDDNLASLKLLLDTLTREGFQVLPADSAELALAAMENSNPDLILLDLKMHGMDGFDMIRRLKASPGSQDIPVIFLSAATDTELRIRGFQLGAVDFVSKPFEYNELLARVGSHLELLRLRNELRQQAQALRRANAELQTLRETEARQAQRALSESQQSLSAATEQLQQERAYLAAIVESSADAIIARNLDGVIASWNPAAQRIFGYTAGEMIGQSIAILLPPDRQHEATLLIDSVRQGQVLFNFETERICKDGTRILVALTVSPIRDNAQHVIGASSIVRDITQQRRTEEALRESEERWKFALEGSSEGVWDWNIQTNEVLYSRHWKRMLGYSENEISNTLDAWKQLVHPGDLPAAQATIQAYLSGERADYQLEHRLRCKDGSWKWILSRGMVVARTPDKQPTRMIGTHLDITARKESELQISFMAYHDRLTGLPNRTLFFDRLSQSISKARRNRNRVALLFGDLDGFKHANDQFGHDAGDIVLKIVASRLLSTVRAIDTVARIGGDEFVVILGDIANPDEAEHIGNKLIHSVIPPIALPGNLHCSVGLSIGISIFPDHGTEMDTLLAAADSAMYQSKTAGKGKCTLFDGPSPSVVMQDNWIHLDASCHVGVAQIDQQHQQMADLVNALNLAVLRKDSAESINQKFQALADCTKENFDAEHALMERYHYPDQGEHDAIHGRLLADLLQFKSRLNKGGDLFVLQSIKDWLLQHIPAEDKPLGEFLREYGQ